MEVGGSQASIVLEVSTLDSPCSKTTSPPPANIYILFMPRPPRASIFMNKIWVFRPSQEGRKPRQLVGTRSSLMFRLLLPPAWYLEEIWIDRFRVPGWEEWHFLCYLAVPGTKLLAAHIPIPWTLSIELFPERFRLFTRLSLLNIVIVKSEYSMAREECSRLTSHYKAEKTEAQWVRGLPRATQLLSDYLSGLLVTWSHPTTLPASPQFLNE